MKNIALIFIAALSLSLSAMADDQAQPASAPAYMYATESYAFKIDMAAATKDVLAEFITQTSAETIAFFTDGTECAQRVQAHNAYVQDGLLIGYIVITLDGNCLQPKKTQEQSLQSMVDYARTFLDPIPGLKVNWTQSEDFY
jgi:hypothetical protein